MYSCSNLYDRTVQCEATSTVFVLLLSNLRMRKVKSYIAARVEKEAREIGKGTMWLYPRKYLKILVGMNR